MRRIIFIVLLAILPVQFSWAAASAYCHHESGAGAKHFGHHEHQHKAGPDGASKDKKASSSGQADNDCGTCQFSAAQAIPAATAEIPAPSTEPQQFACASTYRTRIPSGPERPDRDASTPAVRFGGAVVIGALLLA